MDLAATSRLPAGRRAARVTDRVTDLGQSAYHRCPSVEPALPVPVRLATAGDLSTIQDITNWAIENTPAHFATAKEDIESWQLAFAASQDRYPWLVHESDGTVTGFAKGTRFRDRHAYTWTAEVSVFVHPDHHRKGIGHALYRVLLPLLEAQGFQTAIAGITLPHAASEALHAKMGFRKVGTITHAGFKLGAWHDVSYWQLDLARTAGAPRPLQPVSAVYPAESGSAAR